MGAEILEQATHPATGFASCIVAEAASRCRAESLMNRRFAAMSAGERVRWALGHLPAEAVLSSSFGAQSAVMLHLVTREQPDIPVILVDTGYLFPETYRFIAELRERLDLNLSVYRAERSAAWQEAIDGRRWLAGREGIDAYNDENKIRPMRRALRDLDAGVWFAGPRRGQSAGRADKPWVEYSGGRWKVYPIVDWTDRDVHHYLVRHALPYHPLWHAGYVSIGDWHTTRALHEVDSAEQTRFFGLQRECGLHHSDPSDS